MKAFVVTLALLFMQEVDELPEDLLGLVLEDPAAPGATTESGSDMAMAATATTYPVPTVLTPTPAQPPAQAARGARYDYPNGRPLVDLPPRRKRTGVNHWMPVDDLPVQQSGTIVIAWAIAATSHLSPDGTGSYTEYTLRLTRVLQNYSPNALSSKQDIAAVRPQGVLQWPDGHIEFHRLYTGMGIPKKNGRYVFFLNWLPDAGAYEIITGYRLANSRVEEPLDSYGPFDINTGLTEARFIDRVISAIARQPGRLR